jgi:predicted MFS family arabinose efflux permease
MPPKLTEKRLKSARLALLAVFFIQGIVAITTLPRIPELIKQINVDFLTWGLIIGLSGVGSFVAFALTSRVIARFGNAPVMKVSSVLVALVIAAQGFVTSPVLFFFIMFLQSFTYSMFNIALNGQSVKLQKRLGKVMLGSLHGAWSIGAAISAALSGWLASVLALWIHLIIVPAVCLVASLIATRYLLTNEEEGHSRAAKTDKSVPWSKTPGYLWLLSLGLFAGMWAELVMMDWSAVFSDSVLGLDATRGALPYTVFTLAMIAGRFSSGWFTKRMHFSAMSAWGGIVGSIAMAIGVFWPAALVSAADGNPALIDAALLVQVVFYGIAGLGMASMVPSFFSASGDIRGLSTAQALSRMNFACSVFIMIAKAFMGALATGVGLVNAMIFPLVAFFAAGLISAYVAKNSKRIKAEQLLAFPPTGPVSVIPK